MASGYPKNTHPLSPSLPLLAGLPAGDVAQRGELGLFGGGGGRRGDEDLASLPAEQVVQRARQHRLAVTRHTDRNKNKN
jgi:hypothetical protein